MQALLPDDSQRLSSQSNSSSASSGSDTNAINNNNNTSSSNSDKLSQADSGFTADSVCEDSMAESPSVISDDANEGIVDEKL